VGVGRKDLTIPRVRLALWRDRGTFA
jgi:hypothetical protein